MIDWIEEAACRGMDTAIFFPDSKNRDEAYEFAKKICARCHVRPRCLALSIPFIPTGDRYGVFGGLTPAERRLERLRKKQ